MSVMAERLNEIRAEVRAGQFERALYLAELLELEFNDAITNDRIVVGDDGDLDIQPRHIVRPHTEAPRGS
ncbi:hypothetical protein LGR54_24700 [Ancylobacter sp. Lp-2]|uniref:hypothetical protein n=1 Tax=Ancylobacter sp. Lp-2 TaxID=2881339 RepID=UPI001E3C232D|nr:hypothetical protein [Ancylobacter sp. Lp-2]MCB4771816.1 hypothetical protein [Ancylobacter sp. Lp-2]